jgi:hypothetical protein
VPFPCFLQPGFRCGVLGEEINKNEEKRLLPLPCLVLYVYAHAPRVGSHSLLWTARSFLGARPGEGAARWVGRTDSTKEGRRPLGSPGVLGQVLIATGASSAPSSASWSRSRICSRHWFLQPTARRCDSRKSIHYGAAFLGHMGCMGVLAYRPAGPKSSTQHNSTRLLVLQATSTAASTCCTAAGAACSPANRAGPPSGWMRT